MILCENENESGHDERKAKTRRSGCRVSAVGLQFIGAAERLAKPKSVPEVSAHLEGVHVWERLLCHCRQLPQDHAKGPLQQKQNTIKVLKDSQLQKIFFIKMVKYTG